MKVERDLNVCIKKKKKFCVHTHIFNSFGSYERQIKELLLLSLDQLLPDAIVKAPQVACWFCHEEKVLVKYMNTKKGKGKCNLKITEKSLQPAVL